MQHDSHGPGQTLASSPARDELFGLLQREQANLRVFLRCLLGRTEGVEDLLQDVMERALRYGQRLDARAAPRAWLKRIALRVFLDGCERDGRLPQALGEQASEFVQPDPEVGAGLMAREQLQQALGRLSPVEGKVLTRFHGAGQSVEEIAEQLGMPVGTVKSHLHRARRRLSRFKETQA